MRIEGPVRIGFIGHGGFAKFLMRSWRGIPGIELVAISGTDRERLERSSEEMGIPRYYIGHEGLLADPEVDVVAIASTPALHARHAIEAAQAGKHLYCEKPLAISVAEGEAVLDAVRATGVRAVMSYIMRYTPLARLLRQLVTEGILGELHRVDLSNFAADEALPPDHWFWNPAKSGGILIEHGVHFFDLYSWIIGSPARRVTGHRTTRPGTSQEDRVVATVEYENGVLGTYYHAFDKPSRLERTWAHLGLDRGYLRLTGWIPLCLELRGAVDEAEYARLLELCPLASVTLPEEYTDEEQIMCGGGHQYHVTRLVEMRCQPELDKAAVYAEAARDALLDLIAAIRNPGHQVLASLEAGLESLRVAAAVPASPP